VRPAIRRGAHRHSMDANRERGKDDPAVSDRLPRRSPQPHAKLALQRFGNAQRNVKLLQNGVDL
jgi:hypothetical protein